MTREEIIQKAEGFGPWYHAIELFPGYTTQSKMMASFPQWEQVRAVRQQLDYKGKIVLDLGTMDGMWAFEAEALGATVAAADIWQNEAFGRERFELAKLARNSRVQLYAGANAHKLTVDVFAEVFDIIQCLGLLYHVQNPLLVLHQIAHSLKEGGYLLLETATLPGQEDAPPIMRFNSDSGIYCDTSTYWVPNWNCLQAMLKLAGLNVVPGSARVLGGHIDRTCLICKRDGKLDPTFGLE